MTITTITSLLRPIIVRKTELGLEFVDGEFTRILGPGRYRLQPWSRRAIAVVDQRRPYLIHADLDVIVATGALAGLAEVVDLGDRERALVWIDGRFDRVLAPGLHAVFTGHRRVEIQRLAIESLRFQHPERDHILARTGGDGFLVVDVEAGFTAMLLIDGQPVEDLEPGRHVFWQDSRRVRVEVTDRRQQLLDITGQDILTADRVSLRLNLVVGYRVADARAALLGVDDPRQALYRTAQLAVRAAVGTRTLDQVLADKAGLGEELARDLTDTARTLGLALQTVGVRDIILPGEMKSLLNRVTEAKAAAEANLIARREETAAMRSQANTAKLLADNPVLMRLHELDVLKQVAATSNLEVLLGEVGLTERVTKML